MFYIVIDWISTRWILLLLVYVPINFTFFGPLYVLVIINFQFFVHYTFALFLGCRLLYRTWLLLSAPVNGNRTGFNRC